MFCVNCGSKVDEKALFCNNCGFKLKEVNTSKNPNKYKKDNSSAFKISLSNIFVCVLAYLGFIIPFVAGIISLYYEFKDSPEVVSGWLFVFSPFIIVLYTGLQSIVAILSTINLVIKKNILLIIMFVINSFVLIMSIKVATSSGDFWSWIYPIIYILLDSAIVIRLIRKE